jgi:type III restriction enzyme
MYDRLEESQDPDDPDLNMRTVYTDEWTVEKLEEMIKTSLAKLNIEVATESMKQKFLQSLGTLRRKASEFVRYTPIENDFLIISTKKRQANSVSAAELRSNKTVFYTDDTKNSVIDEQMEFYEEAIEPGSGFKCVPVQNPFDFKTPLNLVIADSENERKFVRDLIHVDNAWHYDKWIKSTATRFYEIDYAWKKGAHPKRGKFSPDYFIKKGALIIIVEIKGDEELREPSPENIKKNEYAVAHFDRVNTRLENEGSTLRYKFTFLTESSFNAFFQSLRDGNIENFRSELDVKLAEENQ